MDGEHIESRYRICKDALMTRGQQHVLRWWDELQAPQRESLLADIESIPWNLLDPIVPTHVLARPDKIIPADLAPADVYPQTPDANQGALYTKARAAGRDLIASGKVAAFTVAGGQGTRLGFDGPKGAVEVTPAGSRTLFEVFALTVRAVSERHGVRVPWYIMTSPANHDETLTFLTDHDFFGLSRDDVSIFSQGMLPAFDHQGRLLLSAKDHLALAPDGHGGSLKALVTSGALADMMSRGIEVISYFQIDNPLVKPFDPLFLGLHHETGSEMSTKVARKADHHERVGNVCEAGGKTMVIEYSDFPPDCAEAKNEDGSRRFDAGNLAIHLLDVPFVERVVAKSFKLPFRRAEKIVPWIDEQGIRQEPSQPNAIKLETFVFDVLPLADRSLVLEVDRAEEFSPVKNATGVDSLESSRRDQNARACRWLEAAGVMVPRLSDGSPDVTVAISPLVATDAEDLRGKVDNLKPLASDSTVHISD